MSFTMTLDIELDGETGPTAEPVLSVLAWLTLPFATCGDDDPVSDDVPLLPPFLFLDPDTYTSKVPSAKQSDILSPYIKD